MSRNAKDHVARTQVRPSSLARGRIMPRDLQVLGGVHDHKVMRTEHLHHLYFPGAGERSVRLRLRKLHGYGLLDRFRPLSLRGSNPYHWVLGSAGARLLAQKRGAEAVSYRFERAAGVADSPRLGHILGLVDCLVAFTLAARTTPGAELVQWLNEAECAQRWGRHARPDAYVRWEQEGEQAHVFVEYDTGSETLAMVRDKMTGYADLARATRFPSVVLFVVHSRSRESNLAGVLAPRSSSRAAAYLATYADLAGPGPAGAVWRSAHSQDRLTLTQVAERHPID
ncbi:protein involved in plasmid replication-relaxation [Nocardiopsis sp. Huas11]|uniref:replication-relaxation family protein n=1 Tax=Nocardiopsis sp. Huas11 TaxID=2183912 RepID=UPI000EB2BAF3|nr:replication-relaxation family protein [Nocardiopsis sp. Huas11]RKS04936.1 protein involved in plasmid replication-relaxation [Nocardiopsis sp. Huas11]